MKSLFKRKRYFENSREHLDAELQLIELLIKKQVLLMNEQNSRYNKFDEFSGMYISEEEINSYIEDNEKILNHQKNANNEKVNSIEDKITRLRNQIDQLIDSSLKKEINLRLVQFAEIFQISRKEIEVLLCSMAPDIDMRFERYFSYLQNDVSKKRPSVQLLGRIFFGEERRTYQIREFLDENAPLISHRLITFNTNGMTDEVPLPLQQPRISHSIIDFLLEIDHRDITLKGIAELDSPHLSNMDSSYYFHHKKILKKIVHYYEVYNAVPLTYISALKGSEKSALIDSIAYLLNKNVLTVKCSKLTGFDGDLLSLLNVIERERLLHSSIVHFSEVDSFIEDYERVKDKIELIKDYLKEKHVDGVVISGTKQYEEIKGIIGPIPRHFYIPPPTIEERGELWKSFLKCASSQDEGELVNELATKFRFTPGQIKSVLHMALLNSVSSSDNEKIVELNDLYKYCREVSNQGLLSYAQKIKSRYTWDDIIIPGDILNQLKEICNCVKNRKRVYEDWGFETKFSLGKGLNILFSGPSGTGKTMSAEIIANDLSLDLYKIDISRVVSKYIGETEKNLSRIFHEAETSNSILFFDESDALFGKRTEVKDSHDRYANIEISFLLQKIEEYEGMIILATNLMKNLDSAFIRRLSYVVEFPIPDEKQRKLIWSKVFPQETPKPDDLDFDFLSRRFKIAGGNIKNIAVNSAFLAANNGDIVNMEKVVLAIKREYQKMGKLCSKSDFGQYYRIVKNELEQ